MLINYRMVFSTFTSSVKKINFHVKYSRDHGIMTSPQAFGKCIKKLLSGKKTNIVGLMEPVSSVYLALNH